MNHRLAYFCSSTSWGGLEMNHLRNAVWMSKRGHDVIILGIHSSQLHKAAIEKNVPFRAIQPHRRWYDFKASRLLRTIISEEKITHLLIRSARDMSVAAGVKFKLKDAIHVSYFMEMQLGITKKSIFHTLRYRWIDVWSCPLEWLKEQVEEKTRFRNQLVVIPSGIDLTHFQNLPSKEKARLDLNLNLSADTFIFGQAGRFDPKKGQLLLLEAMRRCQDDGFILLFMGNSTLDEGDEYIQSIQQFIEKFGLEKRVLFKPYHNEMVNFYRAIDWLVVPSVSETVGMVSIESLACGTPILGSNAGGTPEIMKNQKGGQLFESMNSVDLSQKMEEILNTREVQNEDQLRSIIRPFDHDAVCTQVESILSL